MRKWLLTLTVLLLAGSIADAGIFRGRRTVRSGGGARPFAGVVMGGASAGGC